VPVHISNVWGIACKNHDPNICNPPPPKNKKPSKKVAEQIKALRENHPQKQVELGVQDEGRVGLKPEIRRIWAARGKRPIILQKRGYQWVYVYTFVEPCTGKTDFLMLPTVSITLMELALKEFSKQIDPKGEKKILLLLDGAGWHSSPRLKVPENIVLQKFPPYTPELSPAEPLVKKVKESIYNRTLTKIEDVIERLTIQCQRLGEALEEIKSLCYFTWIRDIWESN
jgi:transposase